MGLVGGVWNEEEAAHELTIGLPTYRRWWQWSIAESSEYDPSQGLILDRSALRPLCGFIEEALSN